MIRPRFIKYPSGCLETALERRDGGEAGGIQKAIIVVPASEVVVPWTGLVSAEMGEQTRIPVCRGGGTCRDTVMNWR